MAAYKSFSFATSHDGSKRQIVGTVFDDAVVDSHPRLWTRQSLAQEMISVLPGVLDSRPVLAQVLREPWPALDMQKSRALTAASPSMQRSAGDSKRGLDHLLPSGLGARSNTFGPGIRLEQEGFLNPALEALTSPDRSYTIFALIHR